MANAFTLFGEIKVDTKGFKSSLREADSALLSTKATMDAVERSGSLLSDGLMNAGKAMTAAVTVPIVGAGAAAVKSAVDFDTLRTQLKAATGSSEAANAKFKELNKLSQENAGVLTRGAVATYGFLKPLGFMDDTINETIKAFGKLKAANPEVDLNRMAVNLGQLFDQGFEQQDLKELMGNFPRAGEILKKAFALKANGSDRKAIAEEMKGLMASGLTKEDLFKKFAEGINTDSFLKNLEDPIAVRMEKMKERIFLALEPLGVQILSIFEKFAPPIIAFIQQISAAFVALSPSMQTAVIIFAAIAAAIGPILIMLGTMGMSLVGLVAAFTALAPVAPILAVIAAAVAGLTIAMIPVIAIAALFYQAWSENWELAKQVFNDGVAYVTEVVNTGLTAMNAFWQEHGTAIMEYATAFYNTIAQVVSDVMAVISDYVKLGLQILSGDWSGAWQTFLDIVTQVWALMTTLISNGINVVIQLVQAAGPILLQAWAYIWSSVLQAAIKFGAGLVYIIATLPLQLGKLVVKFFAAGQDIANAIWSGIKSGLGLGGSATSSIGGVAFDQGWVNELMKKFGFTGDASAGMGGQLGNKTFGAGNTFLTPIKTDAIQTAAALDVVKKKTDEVKKAASTKGTTGGITSSTASKIDELMGIAQAAKAGMKYGKPGSGLSAAQRAIANAKWSYDVMDPFTGKMRTNFYTSESPAESMQRALEALVDSPPNRLDITLRDETGGSARITTTGNANTTFSRYGS